MAKNKDKADKPAKEEAKAEKEKEREFKYGVEDLAEELGIKPASVRVQLRNKGIEKAGKSYGWNSKADLKEIVDQLKASKAEGKTEKAAADDGAKGEKKKDKKKDKKKGK